MTFEEISSNRYAGRPKPQIPISTRRAVEKRAAGVCERCGDKTMFAKLELHHLHYDTEGRETPDDLEALCRSCHKSAHTDPAGQFWVDPSEMDNFWCTYYAERDRD